MISRSDLACATWQKSIAANCPQLLKPRACFSAWCSRHRPIKPIPRERRKGDFYSREFVRFVAERCGADKLSAMTRSADDLRQALGKDEIDLHPEWLAWLRSRYASGA